MFSGSNDCHIIQWQINDGSIKAKFEGHSDRVRSIFISADSCFLVSGGELDYKVIILDVESAVAIRELNEHQRAVLGVVLSFDGKLMASCSADNSVRIWELESGNCLHFLKKHSNGVTGLCFSSDGKLLISCSWDKTIKIWNTETG